MKRTIIAAAAALAVMLAGPAGAEVIASCGPLAGQKYVQPHELHKDAGWIADRINSISVFVKSGDKLDLIITGRAVSGEKTWTRSASDYGAPVLNVGGRQGEVMHILVAWGPVTELYALDLKRKTLGLASHKTGLLAGTVAMVGPCE